MSDRSPAHLPKWPFYVGDALLLALACLIYWQGDHAPGPGHLRLLPWEAWALVACVALGAALGVLPHLLEHRAAARLAEAQHLDHAVLQVQNIEIVAKRINSATASWQAVQDDATKAVQAAREIAESISTEARAFQDFLSKANETEKAHLRLEVEKLRRAEAEWLQVVTWILDHTYAIYAAAVRSGQPGLTEQLSRFQRASHDAARRVGIVPFAVPPGEAYDARAHQLAEPQTPLPPNPVVAGTLALGIRYQGRVVRQPTVALRDAAEEPTDPSARDAGGPDALKASPPAEASTETPQAEAGTETSSNDVAEGSSGPTLVPAQEAQGDGRDDSAMSEPEVAGSSPPQDETVVEQEGRPDRAGPRQEPLGL